MSSKSSRPGKRVNLGAPPPPRQLEEIQADFNKTLGEVAQAQYQAFVYEKETERLNQLLANLSQEAARRNELNKQAEVKNES